MLRQKPLVIHEVVFGRHLLELLGLDGLRLDGDVIDADINQQLQATRG